MDIKCELRNAIEKYKNKTVCTGEIRIDSMAWDCLQKIEEMESEVHRLTAELKIQTERADRAEKRAEAAIADLKAVHSCRVCKHGVNGQESDNCSKRVNMDTCFEWRDVEGEV
jgi:hypothetical protein